MARRRGHNEGSIYQTKDGSWRGAVSLGWTATGKQRRKYVSGKSRAEVSRRVAKLLAEHQRGMPVTSGSPTVQEFLEQWLEEVVKPKHRARTYDTYEGIIRVHLIPALGRHKVDKLTALHIQQLLNAKRAAGTSGQTLTNIRALLRSALNQAMKWDMVPRNVAALTDPPKVEPFEANPIPASDVVKLLAAARGSRLEALLIVTVWLGLRQGEVLGLRWSDLNLEGQSLRIQKQLQWTRTRPRVAQLLETKTKRSQRTLPLPAPVVTALQQHRKRQLEDRLVAGDRWKGEEWDLVFCSAIGTPVDPSGVSKQYRALLQHAGIEPRRFHDLRHSSSSFLAARGVHPRVIMEILGHSQISTTMNTYTHVDLDAMRKALDSISDIFEDDKQSS